MEQVEGLLKAAWPQAEVILFGSAANGLAVRGTNDLDICLQLPPSFDSQESKAEAAVAVAEKAREAGMEDVVDLPGARIPVVKFCLPNPPWHIDVTINNALACANTRLLAAYSAVDPRFAQLVRVVKHWAKQRRVNESYTGTLSSYCYALMCVHLCQTRRPPILPSLQMLPHQPKPRVNDWDVSYYENVRGRRAYCCIARQLVNIMISSSTFLSPDHRADGQPPGLWQSEQSKIVRPGLGLFRVLGVEARLPQCGHLRSHGEHPHQGRQGLGAARGPRSAPGTWRSGPSGVLGLVTAGRQAEGDCQTRFQLPADAQVCIEDPFELSHDLGRTVDKQTSGVLRKEFLRAATILRDQPNPLNMLFEPFRGRHVGTQEVKPVPH